MAVNDTAQIVSDTILKLADKLGIAVEQIARIYMTAQFNLGLVDLAMILGVAISTIIVFVVLMLSFHKDEKDCGGKSVTWTDDRVIGPAFWLSLLWLIFAIIISAFLGAALDRIVAPEYMGLQQMISDFKP